MSRATILLVASTNSGIFAGDVLGRRGFSLVWARDGVSALEAVQTQGLEAIVLLLPVVGARTSTLIEQIRRRVSTPLVVCGADSEVGTRARAFELGAYEYVEDPGTDWADLVTAVEGAIGSSTHDVLLAGAPCWSDLVGSSPAMQRVVTMLQQICRRTHVGSAPTVLLTGETGTGKGLVARCLHHNGVRRSGPFIEVNCASLPAPLLEAELFGHERRPFVDAKGPREGLFERANGGTLFLDEIGAIPLELQPKLLTAIEDKKLRRVGGWQSVQVDVQIIAATHENLEQRVRAGTFRSDLFHRLNVVSVRLPALRDRGGDSLLLAEHFLATLCRAYELNERRLSREAREWIVRYGWPGNVRELRNCLERVLLLEDDEVVRLEHLQPTPSGHPSSSSIEIATVTGGVTVSLPPEGVSFEELEYAVLREALVRCNGNVSRAARFLSISRQTLIYRMKKYRLHRHDGNPTSGTFPVGAPIDEEEQAEPSRRRG